MTPDNLAAFTAKAQEAGTSSAGLVKSCDNAIAKPQDLVQRGGADADTWPHAAMACAFAYLVTKDTKYMAPALKYWNAALNDDQQVGDGLGCTANASPTWKNVSPRPPVILTVTHDTGYPIRWYGPYLALAYDWLYNAPGVDDALRSHTRFCLTSWIDFYTQEGYLRTEPGSNYNAGYVAAKTFTAIAFGTDAGADGDRLWTETIHDIFNTELLGAGMAGSDSGVGTPAGAIVGGDWGEGWQYGTLSVLEYAIAVRAMEEHGLPLPALDAWTNSMIVAAVHQTVPSKVGYFPTGDYDVQDNNTGLEPIYAFPAGSRYDAVLAVPSSDQAAAWALNEKQQLTKGTGTFFGNVLAEIRDVQPQDYRTQSSAPPLWYLVRGTRQLVARTSWDSDAYWAIFTSAPAVNSDHHHFDASNFAFSRGADDLVVDPSPLGTRSTLTSNAVSADSAGVPGDYAGSQTPWNKAELMWARGTESKVYAARSDFARAFDFSGTPSDIPYAHREFVLLPEGEIVLIDRVVTGAASRNMYITIHTNTGGTLKMTSGIGVGTVGGSQVAIHPVVLSSGSPNVTKPAIGECHEGRCTNVRVAVDAYNVQVAGPSAVAVHVIDGLATGEDQATVASLNDPAYDPGTQNAGVIGAAVYRGSKQSYVVASSAPMGDAGAMMTYAVLGTSAGRHIVFDAPEDGSGKSMVTATNSSGQCLVTITAGDGFTGHPLMFQVSAAADGCTVAEDTDVPSSGPPPGGGRPAGEPLPGDNTSSGCKCAAAGSLELSAFAPALIAALAAIRLRRRPRRRE